MRVALRRRSVAEWLTAAEAGWMLARACRRLHRSPEFWSDVSGSAWRPAAAGMLTPARLCSVVGAVARHHPAKPTCLAVAIASGRMLARRGHAVVLVLGVRSPREGPFEAHAWIECDGHALPADSSRQYADLHRVPLSTSR